QPRTAEPRGFTTARKGRVETSDAKRPGNTSTGWPSPRGARLSSGSAPTKAPNSESARPSRNIRVLDGGRSEFAATDIVSPVQAGPLRFGSQPMAHE